MKLTIDNHDNLSRPLALAMAGLLAEQEAQRLGYEAAVGLSGDGLTVSLVDAADRPQEVFLVALERSLGSGFTVTGGKVALAGKASQPAPAKAGGGK